MGPFNSGAREVTMPPYTEQNEVRSPPGFKEANSETAGQLFAEQQMPLPPDLTRCHLTANVVVFGDVAKNFGTIGVPYLIRRVRETTCSLSAMEEQIWKSTGCNPHWKRVSVGVSRSC